MLMTMAIEADQNHRRDQGGGVHRGPHMRAGEQHDDEGGDLDELVDAPMGARDEEPYRVRPVARALEHPLGQYAADPEASEEHVEEQDDVHGEPRFGRVGIAQRRRLLKRLT